ncbi:mitochondrial fission process protein 1 [Cydia fagiglandana]|uniref:mitochondrial fission process protein 1 n=1 Tax=Cydia fagiglandana TaxID=1458189 RepID=UPI002FEE4755
MVYNRDFFRDTKVRYLGYANEVGEALRPVISRNAVNFSYKVAGAYVLADTADKSLKTLWREGSITSVILSTGDALIWQTLASIVIPGITINRIVFYTGRALKGRPVTPAVQRFAPVAVGLACIPIIVTPIDRAVSLFMNVTYRLIFGHHP